MKRDELSKLGLEDEAINTIMAIHGADIEKHKQQILETEAQIKALQDQLGEANQAIDGFKAMDVDAIKKAADDWKAKAEQAQKEAADQIQKIKFDHSLETALANAKAKNPKAVKALINTQDLKVTESGELLGLKEQLEAIKADNDYLFENEGPELKVTAGGAAGNQSINTDSVVIAARKAAGLPID